MDQNPTLLYAFIGFVVVMIVVVVVFTIRGAKRRTRDMAEAAQRLGFQFLGDHWTGPVIAAQKSSLLRRTFGRFNNAMTGTSGSLQVGLADFTYSQGKTMITQTLACFTQDTPLPLFELRPKGFFDKIGEAIVHHDIDFDSHPDFSRLYHLRSPDVANTRQLFSASLLTYIEQIPPHEKWHIDSAGTTLIIYRGGWTVKPAALDDFLQDASAMARTIFGSEGSKKF